MAFNLADVLGNVSNLDTGREQIEYIDIDLIDDDPNNFYELSELDKLAANIELLGLQQPLRVRPDPNDSNCVIIVSGHRRRAAMRLLVNEGKTRYREIPCIREQPETSPAMQELRLIYANSDTRRMTSAELGKQAQRVEALLYQLKEEGVEFPGRMRDHVAEACRVSKSKLARLKVIRENLVFELKYLYESNQINEATAYILAQQLPRVQRLIADHAPESKYGWSAGLAERGVEYVEAVDKWGRSGCSSCTHTQEVLSKLFAMPTYEYKYCTHTTCCESCQNLVSCKSACPKVAEKQKQLKAHKREAARQEKLAQAAKDAPVIQGIKDIWARWAVARKAAELSISEAMGAIGRTWYGKDSEIAEQECGDAKFTTSTSLPYGYRVDYEAVKKLVQAADAFGCSVDYLLCRTDVPKLDTAKPPAEGWLPLQWIDGREKPHKVGQKAVAVFEIPGLKRPWKRIGEWNGTAWVVDNHPLDEKCVRWFPLPEDEA